MKHKILYVEDDLVFRNQVQKRVEAQGWKVIVASDGKEAMDKFQAEQGNFDVAVLDVGLPGAYDGFQLAEYIEKCNTRIPLIYYSSLATLDKIRIGYKHGAKSYVVKADDIDELVVEIENCLREGNGHKNYLGGGIFFDTATKSLEIAGRKEKLGYVDEEILAMLCKNWNNVVETNWICEFVWGKENWGKEVQVRKSIRRLRELLKDSSVEIKTERNKGYRLVELQKDL